MPLLNTWPWRGWGGGLREDPAHDGVRSAFSLQYPNPRDGLGLRSNRQERAFLDFKSNVLHVGRAQCRYSYSRQYCTFKAVDSSVGSQARAKGYATYSYVVTICIPRGSALRLGAIGMHFPRRSIPPARKYLRADYGTIGKQYPDIRASIASDAPSPPPKLEDVTGPCRPPARERAWRGSWRA